MKIIPYLEISSQIMTLIESAEKELFLVSPYVNFNNWEKMKKCLIRAKNRNIRIEMYVRKNAQQDLSVFKEMGITPILIENLHAKLYVNEKYGIVTSQNLVVYSDINSIDIAYKTENTDERMELIEFIHKSIKDFNIINNNVFKEEHSIVKYNLRELCKRLETKYFNAKFVEANTYLFSGNLFYFADVMISNVYTLKIKKQDNKCDEIITRINAMKFETNHDFKIKLKTDHNKFYYIDLIPISDINPIKLMSDFEIITDNLLTTLK